MLLKIAFSLDASLDYFLLDTPCAQRNAVIDLEIAPKLARCSAETLVSVNKMIDVFLEYQHRLSREP